MKLRLRISSFLSEKEKLKIKRILGPKVLDNIYRTASWFKYRKPMNITNDFIDGFPSKIGLSCSVLCQSKCLYCPSTRGKLIRPKFMSVDLAKIIAEDLKSRAFEGKINFSENGEPLLNPNFFEIYGLFKKLVPNAKTEIYSNMNLLDRDIAEKLLSAGLDFFHVNIDGASQNSYEFMKRNLSYHKTVNNLYHFIKVRDRLNSSCQINIHIVSVNTYFRKLEKTSSPFPNDEKEIIKEWSKRLKSTDCINSETVYQWHKRDKMNKEKISFCRMLRRLMNECFIAPNGDIYLCCFDENAKIAYGNVCRTSIESAWQSSKHLNLLNLLSAREFRRIGHPCSICLE